MSVLFRPRLWAASSLCVFCGLSNRSGSPSRWLRGLTSRDPSSKSVFVPPGPHVPSAVRVRPSVFSGLVTHVPGISRTPTEDPAGFTPTALDSHQHLLKVITLSGGVGGVVPQELLVTDCSVGLSPEHMLLHFHSDRTAVSSF